MASYLLTTEDNPFDPATQFDEWFAWDEAKGYHTCGLIARMSINDADISETDQDIEDDQVLDFIMELNPTMNYKKIKIN